MKIHRPSLSWQGILAREPSLGAYHPKMHCTAKPDDMKYRAIRHFADFVTLIRNISIETKALPSAMASGNIATQVEEISIDQVEPHQRVQVGKSPEYRIGNLSHEIFRYDCLDRRLKQHHVTGILSTRPTRRPARLSWTGIAFSAAVGIGLFQTSGQIIALSGPVGALIAYLFAGLTIFAVMRSLAEMVSVRPVSGALMDFPGVFVDEALGFAVGFMYWCELSCRELFGLC